MAKALMSSHILRKILNAPHVKSISLCSSLFRFLLAGESESQGKVAREQKEEWGGGGGEKRKSLQLSSYILPNAVRPRTGGN